MICKQRKRHKFTNLSSLNKTLHLELQFQPNEQINVRTFKYAQLHQVVEYAGHWSGTVTAQHAAISFRKLFSTLYFWCRLVGSSEKKEASMNRSASSRPLADQQDDDL
jgi:hypothetical protein